MPTSRRADPTALDLRVVAHTHWDREWYQGAPRFRQRLSAVVEALLAGDPDPSRPFLLDGQAVVLEDVVAVRPDLRAPLEAALRSGGLEAGPWYVLADELLPSGEALVRNLLAGRRVVRGFGAEPPPVCYSPDAFGHPAALPALAAGFDLRVGVLWRGYGGAHWPAGDTARWRAPDGSTLLVWHLPPDGYEFGSALPASPPAAAERWQRLRAVVAPRARTGVVLCTTGADHHAAPPDLADQLSALAEAAHATGDRVRRSSLRAWAEAFAGAAHDAADVPTVGGELRDSTGYTWSLQGTFGTRAHQKRLVAIADRLLRHDVEPWVALAALRARRTAVAAPLDGRLAAPALPRLLQRTWTTFLRVLPHDTLCGCSIDAVARALEHRIAVVRDEAEGLRAAALDALLAHDPVAARSRARDTWTPRLVLRNRLPRPRQGLVEVVLARTVRDVPVGPASGGPRAPDAVGDPPWPRGLVAQLLGTRRVDRRRESPQHYPDNDLVEETRALLWLPESLAVPGTGLRLLDPHADAPDGSRGDEASPLPGTSLSADTSPSPRAPESSPPAPVRVMRRGRAAVLDNGRLRLDVRERGLTLIDRVSGRRIPRLLRIAWQADHGDSYTPAPRGAPRYLRPIRARLVQQGPLRAAVRVTFALDVPAASAPDERAAGAPPHARSSRVHRAGDRTSSARVAHARPTGVRIVVHLTCTLDAGASHLGVAVRGVDRAHDHRLRLLVETGLAGARIVADAACWPVERPVGTHPLHRWVALDAGDAHMTLVSDGLAECEVNAAGRLAVTLVRATGELSRRELPERPGHAGWPARIPEAQGPGPFTAWFAVAPGGVRAGTDASSGAASRDRESSGRFSAGDAAHLADDLLLPLVGDTWRDATATAPVAVPGVSLDAPSSVQSLAVMPAEDGDALLLRCVNLSADAQHATWLVPWRVDSAEVVRLDETPVAPTDDRVRLAVSRSADASTLALTLAPFALASLRVR